MKSESEIREALELCQGCPAITGSAGEVARSATIEAFLWCLDLDDSDGGKQSVQFEIILEDMRRSKSTTVKE